MDIVIEDATGRKPGALKMTLKTVKNPRRISDTTDDPRLWKEIGQKWRPLAPSSTRVEYHLRGAVRIVDIKKRPQQLPAFHVVEKTGQLARAAHGSLERCDQRIHGARYRGMESWILT
jgi:hypothetical protein